MLEAETLIDISLLDEEEELDEDWEDEEPGEDDLDDDAADEDEESAY